jgi:hypothetical protein
VSSREASELLLLLLLLPSSVSRVSKQHEFLTVEKFQVESEDD